MENTKVCCESTCLPLSPGEGGRAQGILPSEGGKASPPHGSQAASSWSRSLQLLELLGVLGEPPAQQLAAEGRAPEAKGCMAGTLTCVLLCWRRNAARQTQGYLPRKTSCRAQAFSSGSPVPFGQYQSAFCRTALAPPGSTARSRLCPQTRPFLCFVRLSASETDAATATAFVYCSPRAALSWLPLHPDSSEHPSERKGGTPPAACWHSPHGPGGCTRRARLCRAAAGRGLVAWPGTEGLDHSSSSEAATNATVLLLSQ